MNNNIIVRQETPADFKSVELLTLRTFWNIHCPGCNEHLLVRKIRKSQDKNQRWFFNDFI